LIEAYLANPGCRFLLLTAEPGAAKTAFVAWPAKEYTPTTCADGIYRRGRLSEEE
jgi:hypothetical protein